MDQVVGGRHALERWSDRRGTQDIELDGREFRPPIEQGGRATGCHARFPALGHEPVDEPCADRAGRPGDQDRHALDPYPVAVVATRENPFGLRYGTETEGTCRTRKPMIARI